MMVGYSVMLMGSGSMGFLILKGWVGCVGLSVSLRGRAMLVGYSVMLKGSGSMGFLILNGWLVGLCRSISEFERSGIAC